MNLSIMVWPRKHPPQDTTCSRVTSKMWKSWLQTLASSSLAERCERLDLFSLRLYTYLFNMDSIGLSDHPNRNFQPFPLGLSRLDVWFNENINHRLRYVSAWLPVGGAIWVGLGDVDLMEELYHWGKYFRFQSSTPFLLCSLDSLLVV